LRWASKARNNPQRQDLVKNLIFQAKKGFFRSFSEAKSHDVGYFGAKYFPQTLIPKRLEIICKVSGEIYTPWGIGVQFHDILYTLSLDMLYTSAQAQVYAEV
jgi:hypothetical protein